MRAITWILITSLLALWAYYGLVVAQEDAAAPVPVPVEKIEPDFPSAEELNNRAVELEKKGRHADALAYLERAHDFRPSDRASVLHRCAHVQGVIQRDRVSTQRQIAVLEARIAQPVAEGVQRCIGQVEVL